LRTLTGRISGVLAKPHQIHGKQVLVRGSVGSHLATPGDSIPESIRLADQAMYKVKERNHSKGVIARR